METLGVLLLIPIDEILPTLPIVTLWNVERPEVLFICMLLRIVGKLTVP